MHAFFFFFLFLLLILVPLAVADPQTNLLISGCSLYNATDPVKLAALTSDVNSTFSNVRAALVSNDSKFATSEQGHNTNVVHTLFYCLDYLDKSDCLNCFATAAARIRSLCPVAYGARADYDGCFLRYETAPFFEQGTTDGNRAICGNQTNNSAQFGQDVQGLLNDLSLATPKINGYFAAGKRGEAYAVAYCVATVSESVCASCLSVAFGNAKTCTPFSEGRAIDSGCFMRYSSVDFFGSYQTADLASYLVSGTGGSSHNGAIIGGVVGGVVGLFLLVLVLFLWVMKSQKLNKAPRGNILGATELQGPVNFHYKDLKSATKNFSEENKLGEGGFGDVYKGVLKNGNIVAVKKLAIAQTNRAKADFKSEVILISNVHHRNLVRLLGCSHKGPDLLLVYEYMSNSSLDKFLFGERCGTLNWKQRFDIVVGTARGIAYLHQEFHVCIIHRDIKSSNILLDDDFQPRIADFGLARLLPGDQSHLSTGFAGTLGYTAPEYAIHGQLSEKVDTYSYGVVVLEIISGRKANCAKLEPEAQYLLEWAWKLYENDETIKLVDESLDLDASNREEVKQIIEIALLCTQSTAAARPTMSEVVVFLLSKVRPMIHPTKPTFIDSTIRVRGDASTSTGSSSSASNATASTVHFSAR